MRLAIGIFLIGAIMGIGAAKAQSTDYSLRVYAAYVLQNPVYSANGVGVNGAGIYTDGMTDEMLESLKINRK